MERERVGESNGVIFTIYRLGCGTDWSMSIGNCVLGSVSEQKCRCLCFDEVRTQCEGFATRYVWTG